MPELAVREKVELNIPTPILDAIDHSLSRSLKKDLAQIEQETNSAIERGVETDETAANADSAVQQARKAVRCINEVRLEYTRPIDAGKKRLMDEVKRMLSPLEQSCQKLDAMVLDRARRIRLAEEKARREAEETRRKAEEEARKEQERREKISLSKGGTGEVAPVEPEYIPQPVSQIGMRSVTRTKSIVDNDKIRHAVDEGIREIPGVRIYQKWTFDVQYAARVPEEYRRIIRG